MQYERTGIVPLDPQQLQSFLERELDRLSEIFAGGIENLAIPTYHVEPSKPREGMVVIADGTDWNPGSGAGFYGYRGGSWRFLE